MSHFFALYTLIVSLEIPEAVLLSVLSLTGPIYVLAKVINAVMSSAAEAESESLFLNAGEAVQYIKTLE